MIIDAKARLRANAGYRYGLVNRPPGIGAVPKGEYTWDKDCEGIDRVRHGIVTYQRELTPKEVSDFELLPLNGADGKPLEAPKFPPAILNKVKEAIQTLNYMIEENMEPDGEEDVDAHKTLDIFRKYAASKHLDSAKALKELGYKGK